MDIKQLDKGNELLALIKVTEKALEDINKFIPRDRDKEKEYDDKLYHLYISQWTDCSGKTTVDLARYYGNERVIKVIREELERQLEEFSDMFSKL